MESIDDAIEPLIPGLRRYARAWVRDVALADDLVQDSLERAVGAWRWRRGSVRPWLYAILHNRLVDHGRAEGRRGKLVPIEAAHEADVSSPATQEAGLHHSDLIQALMRLSDDQRAVLLLVSVEDLSYQEAAKVLSVPIGTVMSRISRGRDRLAAMLEADPGPRLRSVK